MDLVVVDLVLVVVLDSCGGGNLWCMDMDMNTSIGTVWGRGYNIKKKSKIWYVGDMAINSYLFLGIFKYFCT